jgi:hypothetical protein
LYELAEGNTWRVSQGEASAFETRTENDLALAYKLQVSSVANNSKYDEIVRAFRAAGITKEELNEAKLKQWDSEWLALFRMR